MKKFTILAALIPAVLLSQNFEETAAEFKDFYYSSFDTADMDGDGKTDVVFNGAIDLDDDGNPDITQNEIYKNNGGTFELYQNLGEFSTHLGDISFIDFDNDGLLDIVSTGLSYNDVVYYKQYRFKNTGSSFELTNTSPGRIYSNIQVFDLNHDGYLDYAVNGIRYVDGIGFSYAVDFYKNTGTDFVDQPDWLPGTQNGYFQIIDLNNDAYPDAVVMGYNSDIEPVFRVYLNNEGTMELSQNLPGKSSGRMAYADFNADGFQDLVVAGSSGSGAEYLAVYFNDGTGNFTDILIIENEGLSDSSVDTADLNNDGYYDFVIIGNDENYDGFAKVFLYDPATGTFSKAEETGLYNLGSGGNLKVLNYNDDNLPDVLMTGFDWYDSDYPARTKLFKNISTGTNEKPLPPVELSFEKTGNRLDFSWSGATDDKTPVNALQYELKVGTSPGGQEIAKYLVSTPFWFLELDEVPENIYWSVKSIDASKVYSDASEEQQMATIDNSLAELIIYPNPASESVSIQSDKPIQKVELYSAAGNLMKTDFNGKQLNLTTVPKGIYFVKIYSEKDVITKKLMIK